MATQINTLIPNYIDLDFNTVKANLKTQLALNPVFKDFDMEGANITVLMELVSYLAGLNTYYMNMLAKNNYITTSNTYETTHMLAQLSGYNPMGYTSSQTNVQVTFNIDNILNYTEYFNDLSSDNKLLIQEWSILKSSLGITNSVTGNELQFVVMNPTTIYSIDDIIATDNVIDLIVREGTPVHYTYTGRDIVDYKINLPFYTYDYGDVTDEVIVPVQLYVNDEKWTRISDWYEVVSDYDDDNMGGASDFDADNTNSYMLKYDKYQKYYIEFDANKTLPSNTDNISVYLIISSGINGIIAKEIIDTPSSTTTFVNLLNNDIGSYLPMTYGDVSLYTVSNSAASLGGANAETIDEIKSSAIGTMHSQYRNVTKNDYISHLNMRSDIIKSSVWGEQEQSPSGGAVQDYNKIYITFIPSSWDSSVFQTEVDTSTIPFSAGEFSSDYTNVLKSYLEPRKIITTYEVFTPPEVLFFSFTMGLKIKVNYIYANVLQDVKDKLSWYFDPINRQFGEVISFSEIIEFILDDSIVSSTNSFLNIKGLRSLIMREILVYKTVDGDDDPIPETINSYHSDIMLYPRYEDDVDYAGYTNTLRRIKLGYNQFAWLSLDKSIFIPEF